jgi:hypothetical protein
MNGFCSEILIFLFALGTATGYAAKPVGKQFIIQKKLFVGYQSWFRCSGDGSQKNAWNQ